MTVNSQAELDRIFKRLSTDYNALNKKQQAFAIREIGRVRSELVDLLSDYAGSDGVIKRQRIGRLMRDMDDIERLLREHGVLAFDEIITNTSEWTIRKVNAAVGASIGVASFDKVNRHVLRYVSKRFTSDGLVLSDRVWDLSGEIRDELSSVIRSSIIRGEGVSSMIPKIRRVHENETWKIRRLAQTEGSTAYRTATAFNARESEVVQWVKINDRGGHRNHDAHRCYELANTDLYGKGNGIYKPTDSEIYSPHPNCTSFITYVLDERWL